MKPKMTIGYAFEVIANESLDSKFNDDTIKAVASAVRFLKRSMGLTFMQCYILSVVLKNAGEYVTCESLAEHADVCRIRIMSVQPEIDNLVERGFLNTAEGRISPKWDIRYSATVSLINAVRYNHDLMPFDYSETSHEDMWQIVSGLLHDCDYNSISYNSLVKEIKTLISSCGHIEFCRKIKELELLDENLILLLIICNCLVNKSEENATNSDYEDILPEIISNRIVHQFRKKNNELIMKNLAKATDEDCKEFCLTRHGIQELLGQDYLKDETEKPQSSPLTINTRQMFYNPDESTQIERLTDLLDKDNFLKVQERMKIAGMRAGFCTLLHGAPGTGKTETVYQLARNTGRELIQVDLSNIRDKFVGETEKNAKAIFTNYSERLVQSEVAPILFINEADAIFCKRHTDINSEVEQMSNAMQNIMLQAMENFEGIMIATTNLTDNLDTAFERRFLYKIQFKKPSAEVQKKIWLSMIPDLGEQNADILASHYDFSGGQIENVARKVMVNVILYGRTLTRNELIFACKEEQLSKNSFKITS